MADHFVQFECSLPDHHKVHDLAARLKCHEITALGAIGALWARAMKFRPDGNLTGITDRTLRLWILGLPRVSMTAFIDAGFVDVTSDGGLRLHEWADRYARKEARRMENAARMRAVRANARADETGSTPAARATHVQGACTQSAGAEVEVEKEKEIHPPSVPSGTEPPTGGPPGAFALDGSGIPPTPKPRRRAGLPEGGQLGALCERWNALAAEVSVAAVESIDATRERHARARIAEGLLERWDEFAAALRGSAHHQGANRDEWVAGFDWLVGPKHWLALIERSKTQRRAPEAPPAETARARRSRETIERALASPPAFGPAGGPA